MAQVNLAFLYLVQLRLDRSLDTEEREELAEVEESQVGQTGVHCKPRWGVGV